MFEYEIFDPRIGAVIVSVAEYGLTFSKAAVEVMGRPKYVILGFDKKNLAVIVKPVVEQEEKKISFIEKEKNGNVRMNSKEFIRLLMRYFPDDKDKFSGKATRYLSWWEEDIEALIVDLKRPLGDGEED